MNNFALKMFTFYIDYESIKIEKRTLNVLCNILYIQIIFCNYLKSMYHDTNDYKLLHNLDVFPLYHINILIINNNNYYILLFIRKLRY